MIYQVLDTKNIVDSISKRKIFLGKYSGFQRYDEYKYPFAKTIEEKMRNAFWNPKEISLIADRINFPTLPVHAQEVLTINLLFQTVMDSTQNRGLDGILSNLVTSPEWEAVFKTQAFFEFIHSTTYSHIIREVFPDATKVFDRIKDLPKVKNRIEKEVELYNYFSTVDYEKLNDTEKRKKILELLVNVFALESVKFYVSFLVTYTINNSYNNKVAGISKEIKAINFDEDIHVSVFAGLLNILRRETDEGFVELMASDWFEKMATDVFERVAKEEIEWGEYLLSFGNIPTLTMQVIEKFVRHFVDRSLVKIKIPKIFNEPVFDIVSWFMEYKNIDKDNSAGQETEGLAYNIGILQDDVPKGKMTMADVLSMYNPKKVTI